MAEDSASQKSPWRSAGTRPVMEASRYSGRWCSWRSSDTSFMVKGIPFSRSATKAEKT